MPVDSRRVSQHLHPPTRVQFVTEEDSPFQKFWHKSIDDVTDIQDVTDIHDVIKAYFILLLNEENFKVTSKPQFHSLETYLDGAYFYPTSPLAKSHITFWYLFSCLAESS